MFLGLDLGTSGLKALLVDDAENIIAESVAPLQVSRPHDGWVEQDPRDWFTACAAALALSAFRQAMITSAPRPANNFTASRPIPLLAPVTRIVLPERSGIISGRQLDLPIREPLLSL